MDLGYAALGAAALLAGCAHLPPLRRPADPLSAEEHCRLGAAYEAQGLTMEAAKQYEIAARQEPSYAEAWLALGNLSFEREDFPAAERFYREALKAVPGHAGASNNLAMVYLAEDRKLDEAEELARDALAREGPLKPFILDTLANLYLRQKLYTEARDFLARAEAAAPAGDAGFRKKVEETREKLAAAMGEDAR